MRPRLHALGLLVLVQAMLFGACGESEPVGDPPVDAQSDTAEEDVPCEPICSGKACLDDDGCGAPCGEAGDEPDEEAEVVATAVRDATRQAAALATEKMITRLQEELPDFEDPGVDLATWSGTTIEPPGCPLEALTTPVLPGSPCQYVLELAQQRAIADLNLASPADHILETVPEEADRQEVLFWFEQAGTSSVLSVSAALVAPLEGSGLCTIQNSLLSQAGRLGRSQGLHFVAAATNDVLSDLGHEGTYPQMSQGRDLCGFNEMTLETIRTAAREAADALRAGPGPCVDPDTGEAPPLSEGERATWEDAIDQGLDEESAILELKLKFLW